MNDDRESDIDLSELTPAESAAELTEQLAPEAAESLEDMSLEDAVRVVGLMPKEAAGEALAELDSFVSAQIIAELPRERAADLLETMAPDDAADVLGETTDQVREDLREEMEDEPGEAVDQLLEYDPDTAGGIMTPYATTIRPGLTVTEAIEAIRRQAETSETIYYIYVVDDNGRLGGMITMRSLLLSPPSRLVREALETDVVTVNVSEDREEVARTLEKYGFLALPVVDDDRRLLGIVTYDDAIDVLDAEASEDMQAMVGAGGDERPFSPWRFALKKRLPWLHVNLVTAFIIASVISLFEGSIQNLTVLAVLMHIVANMGGNSGAQTLAVTMRGLALGDIEGRRDFGRLLGKELWVALLDGAVIGVFTGLVVWLVTGNPAIGLVIAVAMVVTLLVSAGSGVCIPMGLRAIGLDPAQGSNIILTMVTDCIGFFTFLGLATLLMRYLAPS
jgi:magnesium transporter